MRYRFCMWKRGKSKYKNCPCVIDGIKFQSRREGARYSELKILERTGAIRDLELQPVFVISKGCIDPKTNRRLAARKYIADFKYFDVVRNQVVAEDVKSPATAKNALYRLKRQLAIEQYGDKIFFLETF